LDAKRTSRERRERADVTRLTISDIGRENLLYAGIQPQ
jgi:hypothetical protein